MTRLTLIALAASTLLTSACAGSTPDLSDVPQAQMPAQARQPCHLTINPPHPDKADEENGYNGRGADVVSCDKARQLAVDTFDLEHQLQAQAALAHQHRAASWWEKILGR